MNQARSSLSMRIALHVTGITYGFDPRLNSRALRYEHQFINKQMLTLETFDERNKTDESRRSGCGDFKGLTRFNRASFSPPRSIKRQKEALFDGCTWGGVGGQYSRGLVASSPLPFIPSYFQGSAFALNLDVCHPEVYPIEMGKVDHYRGKSNCSTKLLDEAMA